MKRNDKKNKQESGQILILLALALLALLVVAALAVDGGMLYTERRFAQNAADASSLAGASDIANNLVDHDIYYSNFVCANIASYIDQGVAEAQLRASSNNFLNVPEVYDPTVNQGIYVDCHEEVNNKYIDFYVTLTTETQTSFLHLINNDILYSTVQAVTRLYPQHDLGFGNAIVALNNDCSNATEGIVYNGGGHDEVNISGGGLWSNGCIRINGSANVNLIDTDQTDSFEPSANYIIEQVGCEQILPNQECDQWTSENVLDLSEEAYEIKSLIEEQCDFSGTLTDIDVKNKENQVLHPGTYNSLRISGQANNTSLQLVSDGLENPIFCFEGNVDIQGGTVTGDPVTIYLRNGHMDITATAAVHLIAPFADEYDDFNILDGLVIFMDPDNTNIIDLQGDSTSVIAGTVFSLNGNIELSGNPGATSQEFSTQVIGDNVTIDGNVSMDINFNQSNSSIVDSKIHLLR